MIVSILIQILKEVLIVLTNEKIAIAKVDLVIDKKLEYKENNYYIITDRNIVGDTSILSDSNMVHTFHSHELEKYFITKLDKCFMYNGYEYYDYDDCYYKHAYNSDETESISFREYINASINWERFKRKL